MRDGFIIGFRACVAHLSEAPVPGRRPTRLALRQRWNTRGSADALNEQGNLLGEFGDFRQRSPVGLRGQDELVAMLSETNGVG